MKSSSRPFVVTTALVVGLLAACTGPDAEGGGTSSPTPDANARATFTEIAVPAQLQPTEDVVLDVALVPEATDAPGLVVAVVAAPGAASRLGLWTLDGGSPRATTFDVDLGGTVDTATAAGSDELAAIVGATWSAGAVEPFVLTSEDRASWDRVALGDALAGTRLTAVAVSGDVVHAAGDAAGVRASALVVDGDEVTSVDLPVAAGEVVTVTGVAASGDDVAVLGETGPVGAPAAPVVWTSRDGGATYGDAVPLGQDAGSRAAGVVRAGGAWVVTGVRPDGNGDLVPAAWSSTDGTAWTAEDPGVPHENGWTPWQTNADAVPGAPMAAPDGTVHTWYAGSSSVWGSAYVRSGDGTWSTSTDLVSASVAGSVGAGAVLDARANGTLTVVRHGDGWAGVATVGAAGWTDRGQLAPRSDPTSLGAADPAANGLDYVAVTIATTIEDGGAWRRRGVAGNAELRDGVLTLLDEPLAGLSAAFPSTDPATGARVAVGYVEDASAEARTFVVRHQAGPGEPWVDAQADLTGVQNLSGVDHVDDGWVAVLTERPSSDVTSGRDQLVVLTSVDGLTWQRVPADQLDRPEVGGSRADAVCALPGGGAVVLGSTRTGVPSQTAAAWTGVDGAWRPAAVDGAPDGSSFSSCVTSGDAVLATMDVSGGTEVWSTRDGAAFEKVAALPTGGTADAITTSPAGLVGVGALRTDGYDGPVLWLSEDGASWSWVALPASDRQVGSFTVGAVGDDVVVSAQAPGGTQMWTVSDLEITG